MSGEQLHSESQQKTSMTELVMPPTTNNFLEPIMEHAPSDSRRPPSSLQNSKAMQAGLSAAASMGGGIAVRSSGQKRSFAALDYASDDVSDDDGNDNGNGHGHGQGHGHGNDDDKEPEEPAKKRAKTASSHSSVVFDNSAGLMIPPSKRIIKSRLASLEGPVAMSFRSPSTFQHILEWLQGVDSEIVLRFDKSGIKHTLMKFGVVTINMVIDKSFLDEYNLRLENSFLIKVMDMGKFSKQFKAFAKASRKKVYMFARDNATLCLRAFVDQAEDNPNVSYIEDVGDDVSATPTVVNVASETKKKPSTLVHRRRLNMKCGDTDSQDELLQVPDDVDYDHSFPMFTDELIGFITDFKNADSKFVTLKFNKKTKKLSFEGKGDLFELELEFDTKDGVFRAGSEEESSAAGSSSSLSVSDDPSDVITARLKTQSVLDVIVPSKVSDKVIIRMDSDKPFYMKFFIKVDTDTHRSATIAVYVNTFGEVKSYDEDDDFDSDDDEDFKDDDDDSE